MRAGGAHRHVYLKKIWPRSEGISDLPPKLEGWNERAGLVWVWFTDGGIGCKRRTDQSLRGPRDFRRKLDWRQIAQRAVRTVVIVVVAESLDEFPRVRQVSKLVFVEALVAKFAVKAFDEAVLRRFARRDEAVGDVMVVRPALECQTSKLRPVVREQAGGLAAQRREEVKDPRDAGTGTTTCRSRSTNTRGYLARQFAGRSAGLQQHNYGSEKPRVCQSLNGNGAPNRPNISEKFGSKAH